MKSAIVAILASVAQAQFFAGYAPQARFAPQVRYAPQPRYIPARVVEEEEEKPRRYWRFELDQSQYDIDYAEPKFSASTIGLFNQFNPNTFANGDRLAGILNSQGYQANADKYDQAYGFERSKGINADRSKLFEYDLLSQSAQLQADQNLISGLNLFPAAAAPAAGAAAVAGNPLFNNYGDILDYQRRGVDVELAEYQFDRAEYQYRKGEIDRWEFEEARRALGYREDKERNTLLTLSGNTQLSEFASYSDYSISKDQSESQWDEVDRLEYEFARNPTRENSRALRLAEISAEAAEGKSLSKLGKALGSPLLAILGDYQETQYEEEYYDIYDELLHRDYRQRNWYP